MEAESKSSCKGHDGSSMPSFEDVKRRQRTRAQRTSSGLELYSDSVKRHLRGCHLSVLNLKFDFISDGGCTREEQIALSLKRHLFLHGGREPKAFWICFSRVHPPSEIKSNFKFKTLKRHLLKRHLTLSDLPNPKIRRTVLGSSRGSCYQRDLPMQGIFC